MIKASLGAQPLRVLRAFGSSKDSNLRFNVLRNTGQRVNTRYHCSRLGNFCSICCTGIRQVELYCSGNEGALGAMMRVGVSSRNSSTYSLSSAPNRSPAKTSTTERSTARFPSCIEYTTEPSAAHDSESTVAIRERNCWKTLEKSFDLDSVLNLVSQYLSRRTPGPNCGRELKRRG